MHMSEDTKGASRNYGEDAPLNSLKRSWPAMLFLLFLLVVSGVTASVVGYKVKQADKDRRDSLTAAYQSTGGTPAILSDPALTAGRDELPSETRTFVTAYELNERVRAYGLFRTFEHTIPSRVPAIIDALKAIGATEAMNCARETWGLMTGGQAPAEDTPLGISTNAEAIRVAGRYDRYIIRDTESHLYAFVRKAGGEK
jgi:hypothetical protein